MNELATWVLVMLVNGGAETHIAHVTEQQCKRLLLTTRWAECIGPDGQAVSTESYCMMAGLRFSDGSCDVASRRTAVMP